MPIDFNHLTSTSVTALCHDAQIAPPTNTAPLHLFVRALYANALLSGKIRPTGTSHPRTEKPAVDIKKLQAGDHDD